MEKLLKPPSPKHIPDPSKIFEMRLSEKGGATFQMLYKVYPSRILDDAEAVKAEMMDSFKKLVDRIVVG